MRHKGIFTARKINSAYLHSLIRELGMRGYKLIGDSLIFLRVYRAGGIHEHTTRLKISGAFLKDIVLQGRKSRNGAEVLISYIRLFAENSESRARNVTNDLIVGIELYGLGRCCISDLG